MIVYSLAKQKYCTDLSGTGAEKAGGRWNNKGIKILYTSDSRALCTAEIAVHTSFSNIPKNYYLVL
ncbi:MAG: RES family NAD+ phosphorylase, partial [Bacteroidota bacterium]|nr:RES family NAD+ phosphorylase [Bacteroidota bacterium]